MYDDDDEPQSYTTLYGPPTPAHAEYIVGVPGHAVMPNRLYALDEADAIRLFAGGIAPLPGPAKAERVVGDGREQDRRFWQPVHDRQRAERAEKRAAEGRALAALMTTDLTGTDPLPHPPGLTKHRLETGTQAVAVIAAEPGRPEVGVGFFLLVPFLPPVGSLLRLPDGRECEVKRVQFPVGAWGDGQPEVLIATPNVLCEFTDAKEKR